MMSNSEARKRPFPFPSLLSNEKRDRRNSQSSETSACSSVNIPEDSSKLKCRLCDNKGFKNSEDFDFHLTMIHYRDRLLDVLGNPPYSCKHCGFTPTADDPNEEMILHYGCKERFAIKYYVEECQNLANKTQNSVKKEPMFHRDTVTCKICQVLNTNKQLFLTHITQKHFAEEIRKKLPQVPPYTCPYNKCHQVKHDRNSLLMHYAIDHDISISFYNKFKGKDDEESDTKMKKEIKEFDMFKPKPKQELTRCKVCKDQGKDKKFVTENSLKYHTILTHFFPNISTATGNVKCPTCKVKFPARNEFAKHFMDKHYDDHLKNKEVDDKKSVRKHESDSKKSIQKLLPISLENSLQEELPPSTPTGKDLEQKPLPKCREMQTVHGQQLKEMKTVHKISTPSSSITARQRMNDRWKSMSIDATKLELEKLQGDMVTLKEEHTNALKKKAEEFERWIGQKEQSIEEEVERRKEVEKDLETARVQIADVKKQLEQKDTKITSLEDVVVEEHNRYMDIVNAKKDIESKLATQEVLGKELCDFQNYIDKMKSETKDIKSQLANKTEELNDFIEENEKLKTDHGKQVAKLVKQQETLKTKLEKITEEKKEKMTHIKEITKLHKELESDQRSQIQRLTKENEELKKKGNQIVSKADSKVKELEESTLAKKVKMYEEEKKETDTSVRLLESQRNALLDSLERVQKILQGFESVIKDKNEQIQENSTKLEESEINLEEALQKLSTSKETSKEKKDLTKQVKTLQASLRDYETRQFTNAKLISAMEKNKAALEKKLEDEKSSNSKTYDNDLYTVTLNKAKKLEKTKDKAEQDLAKSQVLLSSKTTELTNVKDKLKQAGSKIKDLERELRLSPSALSDQMDEEKEELKRTVRTLSERYGQLKEEYKNVQESHRNHSDPDGITKQLQSTIESLKIVARTAQQRLSKKEQEVNRLNAMVENQKKFNDTRQTGMIENQKKSKDIRQTARHNGATLSPKIREPEKLTRNLPDRTGPEMKFGIMKIKEEPVEHVEETVEQVDTEERQIVLDIGNHLVDHDSTSSIVDSYEYRVQEQGMTGIVVTSPSYMSDPDSRLGSNGSDSSKTNFASNKDKKVAKAKDAKAKGALVDVTEHYEESEDDITCGICLGWDPPMPKEPDQQEKNKKKNSTYNVGWVGCDCGHWYHKQCTSLKRFTAAFSCKSAKKKCQKKSK